MNKLILLSWLLLASVGLAATTNKISTAFGVELGKPFDESQAIATFTHSTEIAYSYTPTNPVPHFTRYTAKTPGGTNIVIEILGGGQAVDRDLARAMFKEAEMILTLKYGEPDDSDRKEDFSRVTWKQDSRTIDLALISDSEKPGKMSLMVKYRDKELAAKFRPKKKAPDTSGF